MSESLFEIYTPLSFTSSVITEQNPVNLSLHPILIRQISDSDNQ